MITSFMMKVKKTVFGFKRSEDGAATIEFVIMFPVIFSIFLSAYEMGLYMLNNVMLERAADLTVRELRLGNPNVTSANGLKQELCKNLSIVSDCAETVEVALQPVSTATWSPFPTSIPCRTRDEPVDPLNEPTVDAGSDNDLMFVRFCLKIKPFFGDSLSIGLSTITDANDDLNIFATTAFVNEPS
ncbi:TadE/TadG family type IV pilus assembly protein [Parasulfitobacter algicola]|uniref:Pilus assembly protein n=1 Tax=Parasulfitobacter algicola TaxID=2614809 RepID=A0ABX2IUN3_9RHOB|nr:TadE/TadG family type IV pilus assembly protein [Sulfitobacter algicola]NSX53908.1 pilus assembly protein [Sulfitobacter algicola]